jgi:hypothetical protein
MKKHPSRFGLLAILACSLLGISQAVHGVGNTVLWHNLSGCDSPGVLNDVFDCDIDVIGVNALVDGIKVAAVNQDILITVTNQDSVITGSGNRCDGVPTGPSRLYLFADVNRTITFQLTWDLVFRGTSDLGLPRDLLITVSGCGTVQFSIEGDNQVCFTSIPGSGGAQLFVIMDNVCNGSPELRFQRLDPIAGNINDNIEVKVGPKSCISYAARRTVASGTANEEGSIIYDGANTGTGCNILRLENCSCFIIWGHWLTVPSDTEFLLTDIDLAVPAGLEAKFEIANSLGGDVPSSVRLINENQKCPNLLIDPFCDNAFTGTQFGFVLGANGLLQVDNCSYFDYIGTVTNTVPVVNTPYSALQPAVQDLIDCGKLSGAQDLIKERNCSAFFVDGNPNPNATEAQIRFLGTSAIYFRSGVDCEGDVSPDFTIDPNKESDGAGNIVFDVEGQLLVCGEQGENSAMNVLSLCVTKTGCPIFVEVDTKPIFPQRTFVKVPDCPQPKYKQYNKAAWLINNCMEIKYTSLLHTDEIHEVFQNNDLGLANLNSEPTYIGGETWKLCAGALHCDCIYQRPTISLNNSIFRIATSVGLTGVDIAVANNGNIDGNQSIFRFYNNGRAIDNAYGRVYVAGTNIGSVSACGFLIDHNSHIDVFQTTSQSNPTPHSLTLEVGSNDACITEGLTYDISGQCAVHEIYLNNESNISIGTDGDQGLDIKGGCELFDLTTFPQFFVGGEFFSFNTMGGQWGLPGASGTTGQGGIFVDKNGTIKSPCRASFSTMVTRSHNGVIDLPKNQVFFTSRVGTTVWQPNLSVAADRVLVPFGTSISDFTMDWGALQKDYTSSGSFVPYELKCTPSPCDCPPVTDANLRALPIVEGEVDQFQIRRSRIGDQAHLQVKEGGFIRELVFLVGCNPAEAPVGFLVVQDQAHVGIGTAHRNVDSLSASVVLGVNGLSICANGDATIELNEDVIINNVCHILSGTSFGLNGPNVLTIFSEDNKELRVKSTGLLDLTQFNNQNKILNFAGNVRLIFEPGSRLVLGGGSIQFTDETQLAFERVLNENLLSGNSTSDLDDIRVKIIGRGQIIMQEDALCQILQNAFVGIESDPECSLVTSITWLLNNQAKVQIGTDSRPGGVLQVGNATCQNGSSVDLTIILDGVGTLWEINRQGFMGLGVGVCDKASQIPNNWSVNCLENLALFAMNIEQGTFKHNQIRTGDVSTASLLAVGPSTAYTWTFDLTQAIILGGGNMVQITNCIDGDCVINRDIVMRDMLQKVSPEKRQMYMKASQMMTSAEKMLEEAKEMMKSAVTRGGDKKEMLAKARDMMNRSNDMKAKAQKALRAVIISCINPVVQSTAGVINENLQVGIMSSKLLLEDKGQAAAQPILVSPQAYFNYLSTIPFDSQSSGLANIFRNQVQLSTIGFLDDIQGTLTNPNIRREDIQFIYGINGFNMADHDHSLSIGAVGIALNTESRALDQAFEVRGATAE